MNYLVIEGYMEAAENFSKEAHFTPSVPLVFIQQRMTIKGLIQNGLIDEAVDKLNDLDTDVNQEK